MFTGTAEFRIIRHIVPRKSTLGKENYKKANSVIKAGHISPFDRGLSMPAAISTGIGAFCGHGFRRAALNLCPIQKSAYGLMQFMPSTAEYFGIKHKTDPQTQIDTWVPDI